jgi:hypothetical protein
MPPPRQQGVPGVLTERYYQGYSEYSCRLGARLRLQRGERVGDHRVARAHVAALGGEVDVDDGDGRLAHAERRADRAIPVSTPRTPGGTQNTP